MSKQHRHHHYSNSYTFHLLSSGDAMAVFVLMSAETSYVPLGLQQANTVALVFSFTTKPALATLMLCCSIASWMVTLINNS